jgi:quercetin dioxygenase-like cupin family protein
MPTIFEAKDLRVDEKTGMRIATLANQVMLGTDALQVKRITLDANSISESFGAENAERFVYVVRGKGQVDVGDETFALDAESVLWLEKGDVFYFEAGADGLEVLLCHAPVGEK